MAKVLSVKKRKNHHNKTDLQVLNNSLQAQQIIRNCVAYCAFNGALQGSLLQKQAKNLIEGKKVDNQYNLYRILVEVKK